MFVAQPIQDRALPDGNAQALCFSTPQGEQVRYSIRCDPAVQPDGSIRNMSLKQLDDPDFRDWIGEHLATLGVHEAYAPTVNFMSGVILSEERFTRIFACSKRVSIRRPGYRRDSDELQACDGTRILKRKSFLMSAAGCLALVLTGVTESGEDICLSTHAGKNSLIDMYFIRTGKNSRAYFSVVDALVAYAKKLGAIPEKLTLRSFYSIPWQNFPHSLDDPEYQTINRMVFAHFQPHYKREIFRHREDGTVCLSLSSIVQVQAEEHGIGTIETGLLDLPEHGDFAKNTHHRVPELAAGVRNLVVCTHY